MHPRPFTYEELWNYTNAYARAIRKEFPGAPLAGPDTTGYEALWMTKVTSAGGIKNLPMMEAFVRDIGDLYRKEGIKLLDTIDIHCYPEASFDAERTERTADVMLRMRSVRELWDPSFYAESWFLAPTFYLRYVRSLIADHAPWLNLSCTEWNYLSNFDDDDIIGAVVTLDALAVHAREGVDLSAKWTGPHKGTVAEYANLIFLDDFDGHGGSIAGATYVNVSVAAAQYSSEPLLAAHGFISADKRTLHVLLVCRQAEGDMAVDLNLAGTPFEGSELDLYRLDDQHKSRGAPQKLSASERTISMPPTAAALIVARS